MMMINHKSADMKRGGPGRPKKSPNKKKLGRPKKVIKSSALARYVGCRRVVFVAQTATFCVVSATCRDTSLVMSQTQENVVSARESKRHNI